MYIYMYIYKYIYIHVCIHIYIYTIPFVDGSTVNGTSHGPPTISGQRRSVAKRRTPICKRDPKALVSPGGPKGEGSIKIILVIEKNVS